MALADHESDCTGKSLNWLEDSQHGDGSWGIAGGSDEETAYGLTTLAKLAETDVGVTPRIQESMDRAACYLASRLSFWDYPELWIGKGLYTPFAVVRSSVLGALLKYFDVTGIKSISPDANIVASLDGHRSHDRRHSVKMPHGRQLNE
jgi:hypothetical protein